MNMLTIDEIKSEYDVKTRDARRIAAIQALGLEHGAAGLYPGGDFEEHPDWVDDVAVDIDAIETDLVMDEDEVFSLYVAAHKEGLASRAPISTRPVTRKSAAALAAMH